MCGIVGLFAPHASDPLGLARQMAATIVHRGPDDEGFLQDGAFAMGMRRLSIIDLSGGHQPISNETGNLSIVFNGEIYNYRELRDALCACGHTFRTHSDTEVILHAFEEYGPECVHRFNGMFAIAIWDRAKRKLFLARDRMGVKPLYYALGDSSFTFGSEIKAILETQLFPKQLRPEALWHFLSFRYIPQSTCIWQHVTKLPPAHFLTLTTDDMRVEVQRYWDIPHGESEVLSRPEELAHFQELFEDAVRLRLIADVPVGILLSGGLDSSAVAAAVRQVHDAPVKTFSIGFRDGGEADESRYARVVADAVGTDHYEMHVGQEEFEAWIPEFAWATDEPLADSAAVPLYFVSRLASQHVKVVLSGEGSDELMAGYGFESILSYLARAERHARVSSPVFEALPKGLQTFVKGLADERPVGRLLVPPDEMLRWMAPNMTDAFTSAEKRRLWPRAPQVEDSRELVRRVYDRALNGDDLRAILYVFSQDWLVEDLLMKADKMTMAASIELRVPFLDYRLVEWLTRRPSSSKLAHNGNGSVTRKVLLREYAASRLPREIIDRPKVGFATPVMSWIREDRRGMVSKALRAPGSWVRSEFEAGALDRLIAQAAHDERAATQVWHLYVLEAWAQRWL
jgi:asparagine synthase (glutamine-hydrolysing)